MRIVTFGLAALGLSALTLFADEAPSPVTWRPDERAVVSGLYIKARPPARRERVELTVTEPGGVARQRWPVRGGVPMHRGELPDPRRIRLLDGSGAQVPVQGLTTAFWPEKTTRFLTVDFLADLGADQSKTYTLEYGEDVDPRESGRALQISAVPGRSAEIATGTAIFRFRTGTDFLEISLDGPARTLRPVTGRLTVARDAAGADPMIHPLIVDEVHVREQGAVQATVHVLGHYGTERSALHAPLNTETWRFPCSLHFRVYGQTGHVYVEHAFGYNGDEYRDFVQSYGLVIPTGLAGGRFVYGPDGKTEASAPLGARLNQHAHDAWALSSGPEGGRPTARGKRFGGWGAIADDGLRVQAVLREAWQNWPVAIRAQPNGDLVYEILGERPDRALDLRYAQPYHPDRKQQRLHRSHSMYVGERLDDHYADEVAGQRAAGIVKIHELLLELSPGPAAQRPTSAAIGAAHQTPLVPWPGERRFAETRALGHIGVYGDRLYDPMRELFSVLLDVYPVVHEANGLYGWVDWGDVPMASGVSGGRFVLPMRGGVGWSNGERALASYFYHYAAGGGRRFLDLGRAMVHHTIGIDTEHQGGDSLPGEYHRHDQVHWSEQGLTRQGGFRGWHAYYWLTGDPEVGRLAVLVGSDAPANRQHLNVTAARTEPTFSIAQASMAAVYNLATLDWITTGEARYARAHHAIARLWEACGQQGRTCAAPDAPHVVVRSGEPTGERLGPAGPLAGYWYTYGGDDLLLDWVSLTGDPSAVNALLLEGRRHRPTGFLYHSPEALYLALAALEPATPSLSGWMEARLAAHSGLGLGQFQRQGLRSRASYPSAAHWNRYGGLGLYSAGGKNGFSIYAAQALEMLMWIRAREFLVEAAARRR